MHINYYFRSSICCSSISTPFRISLPLPCTALKPIHFAILLWYAHFPHVTITTFNSQYETHSYSFILTEVPLLIWNAIVLPLTGFCLHLICPLRPHSLRFLPLPLTLPFVLIGELTRHTHMPRCPLDHNPPELCRHGITDCAYFSIRRQHVVSTHNLLTMRMAKSLSLLFPDWSQVSPSSRHCSEQTSETLGSPTTRSPPHMNILWSAWDSPLRTSKSLCPHYGGHPFPVSKDGASVFRKYDDLLSPLFKSKTLQSIQSACPTQHVVLHSMPVSPLSPYHQSTTG